MKIFFAPKVGGIGLRHLQQKMSHQRKKNLISNTELEVLQINFVYEKTKLFWCCKLKNYFTTRFTKNTVETEKSELLLGTPCWRQTISESDVKNIYNHLYTWRLNVFVISKMAALEFQVGNRHCRPNCWPKSL